MPENSKDGYTESGKVAAHAQTLAPPRGRTKARKRADTGDRAWLLVGWGRELGGKVLALIDLLLGSATRNLKTPHTRTKASAWGEGRSKLGLGTLRAETALRKQPWRPFLGTLASGDTMAGIERTREALGVAGATELSQARMAKFTP